MSEIWTDSLAIPSAFVTVSSYNPDPFGAT